MRENRKRREAVEAEWRERGRKKKAVVDALLATAPPMSVIDKEGWERCVKINSDGGYGECGVRYAEQWARLMEQRMGQGSSLADCADETSHLADTDGITGFLHGCAVGMLAKVWKHGEDLRRWHNLKTQIHDEGVKANESSGVLNPACLILGVFR